MKIKSEGILLDEFFIPSFELSEGEIVVVNLWGGMHYYPTKQKLVDIFTGKVLHPNVTIFQPLTFAGKINETKLKKWLFPLTVDQYLKKHLANPKDSTIVCERNVINPRAKIKDLDTTQNKLISICCTFSQTKDIVFDLAAQTPIGGLETYELVKSFVSRGGSALLLDWTEEFRNDCTRYIELQKVEK